MYEIKVLKEIVEVIEMIKMSKNEMVDETELLDEYLATQSRDNHVKLF